MPELIKSRDTRGWAARREWRGSPPERGTLSECRFPDSPRGPPKRRLTKRKTDRTSLSFGRKTFLGAPWCQNHSLPVLIWENYGEDKGCGGRLRSFLLWPQLFTASEQAMSQLKNTE